MGEVPRRLRWDLLELEVEEVRDALGQEEVGSKEHILEEGNRRDLSLEEGEGGCSRDLGEVVGSKGLEEEGVERVVGSCRDLWEVVACNKDPLGSRDLGHEVEEHGGDILDVDSDVVVAVAIHPLRMDLFVDRLERIEEGKKGFLNERVQSKGRISVNEMMGVYSVDRKMCHCLEEEWEREEESESQKVT